MAVEKDARMPMILAINDSTYYHPAKFRREVMSANIITGLTKGDTPVMDVARLRLLEKAISFSLKDREVINVVERELETEDKQKASINGITVSIGKAGSRYDYSQCGHPEYERITDLIDQLNIRKREIEEDLKLLYKSSQNPVIGYTKSTKTIVIEELPIIEFEPSGEVVEIRPPSFTFTKSIFVK